MSDAALRKLYDYVAVVVLGLLLFCLMAATARIAPFGELTSLRGPALVFEAPYLSTLVDAMHTFDARTYSFAQGLGAPLAAPLALMAGNPFNIVLGAFPTTDLFVAATLVSGLDFLFCAICCLVFVHVRFQREGAGAVILALAYAACVASPARTDPSWVAFAAGVLPLYAMTINLLVRGGRGLAMLLALAALFLFGFPLAAGWVVFGLVWFAFEVVALKPDKAERRAALRRFPVVTLAAYLVTIPLTYPLAFEPAAVRLAQQTYALPSGAPAHEGLVAALGAVYPGVFTPYDPASAFAVSPVLLLLALAYPLAKSRPSRKRWYLSALILLAFALSASSALRPVLLERFGVDPAGISVFGDFVLVAAAGMFMAEVRERRDQEIVFACMAPCVAWSLFLLLKELFVPGGEVPAFLSFLGILLGTALCTTLFAAGIPTPDERPHFLHHLAAVGLVVCIAGHACLTGHIAFDARRNASTDPAAPFVMRAADARDYAASLRHLTSATPECLANKREGGGPTSASSATQPAAADATPAPAPERSAGSDVSAGPDAYFPPGRTARLAEVNPFGALSPEADLFALETGERPVAFAGLFSQGPTGELLRALGVAASPGPVSGTLCKAANPVTDSLFGVTAAIAAREPGPYDKVCEATTPRGRAGLYANPRALPLVLAARPEVHSLEFSDDPFVNQQAFVANLTGGPVPALYTPATVSDAPLGSMYSPEILAALRQIAEPTKMAQRSFTVVPEKDGPLYIRIDAKAPTAVICGREVVQIADPGMEAVAPDAPERLFGGPARKAPVDRGILYLGMRRAGEVVPVQLRTASWRDVSDVRPQARTLDLPALDAALAPLREARVETRIWNAGILSCGIEVPRDSAAVLTIPHGEGWTYEVDGHKVEPRVVDGLPTLALEAGRHELRATYVRPHTAAIVVLGLLGLALSASVLRSRRR